MKAILSAMVLLLGITAKGADIAYPNPAVVGASIREQHTLLVSRSDEAVSPVKVVLELRKGRIIGAVVTYPKEVTPEMVRGAINLDFAACERQIDERMYVWRNEEAQFAISVAQDDEVSTVIIRSIDPRVLSGNE
jgi:hypothetical protein